MLITGEEGTMSCQFGRWDFNREPTPAPDLDRVRERLSPYGPEGEGHYGEGGATLLWFSFETTELKAQPQPWILPSGEALLWDGRLDNGDDLVREMGTSMGESVPDIEIVGRAWTRWGENSLGRLLGDWALSIWNPRDHCLTLAADVLAIRHLYYTVDGAGIRWSTIPDPLVLLPSQAVSLDEEYLAGWLAAFPAAHLSPFREIRRVPPASMIRLTHRSCFIRRYWEFDPSRSIRHASESEYEEQFREILGNAITRRLRSGFPVLAELSGGMDSSTIVCVADQLTSGAGQPPLDTVSYYDDREPHWNERPWFARVEAQRGRTGLHIDVSAPLLPGKNPEALLLRPGASSSRTTVLDFMMRNGHRVLLSGTGGDEFLGGVPTPLPELEDLLAAGRFVTLWRQLLAWALAQRRPWLHMLGDTMIGFLPAALSSRRSLEAFRSWLDPGFVSRQRYALRGYPKRWSLFGPLPSYQENIDALDGICRQLACRDPNGGYPFDRRYPYLDRDLLEFLFAIPRELLVRPGERRSLMRSALKGIVPEEILHRRRKAYVSRAPVTTAGKHYEALSAGGRSIGLAAIGIASPAGFLEALNTVRKGKEGPALSLLRALAAEEWLEALGKEGPSNRITVRGLAAVDSAGDSEPELIHAVG
jgi:asparagine synthase (glutamine-hydrolysing)